MGRVVAWLECLAQQQLELEESGALGSSSVASRLSREEGVWRETRSRVRATQAAGLAGTGVGARGGGWAGRWVGGGA